ncbi:malonyl CoA-ACP transacylase [Acrocarpospora pleiomorpha]|uniref:Malonyl CoA-ACP transacylase n=1 Tax=Acrocarpospora pleiomorpha TaxID=90975 RepID=A0A5M3XKW2_9ACTN|nr:peptidylprolyl isomerase [Acrocarpospora pleiomorpha]GES20799.1 malonyl CoA-ACP transacylase [Acrocarpospora pleiomorpha]
MTANTHEMDSAQATAALVRHQRITIHEVNTRLALLRTGPLADRLPHPDSPEGRNLRRWLVQLMAAELIVHQETNAFAHDPPTPIDLAQNATAPIEQAAGRAAEALAGVGGQEVAASACDLGRAARRDEVIGLDLAMRTGGVAAAVLATVAGRALFERVIAGVHVDDAEISSYYMRNPDEFAVPETRWTRELGPIRRGELAGPIEDAVFGVAGGDAAEGDVVGPAEGDVVGPVDGPGGPWTLTIERIDGGGRKPYQMVREGIGRELALARREQVFGRWLEGRMAAWVRLSPGFEHPGDPRQPDAVHRH